MNPQAAQSYLKTKVLTATPEQLQLMLYDGALRFCEQARAAIEKKNFEESHNAIMRVQRILAELTGTLRHDIYPELCGKLASLYNFAYRRLIQANTTHDIPALDEAMGVLRYQRETWSILLQNLSKDKAAAAAQNMQIPAPDARMEASISMQG
jgi:flagellar secretion chaperone FliS